MSIGIPLNDQITHSLRNRITRGIAVATVAATLLTGIAGGSASAGGAYGGVLSADAASAAALATRLSDTSNTALAGGGGTIDPSGNSQPAESFRPRRPARSENNMSAEESEYIDALTEGFETLDDSINRFYDLLDDPNLGDQRSINELSDILDTWLNVYGDALFLVPPDRYEEINDAYLELTGSLADAAFALYDGDIVSASTALEDAQQEAEDLVDLVKDLTGSSLLDQPSG
jgi:hypothetical protein